jgi:glycosyltransferase involved in cell wall biosynthesis
MAAATSEEPARTSAAEVSPGHGRRIFIVANSTDELGGLQHVAHLLADGFTKRGHDVDLIGIARARNPHDHRPAGATYRTRVLYEDGTTPDLRPVRLRSRLDLLNQLRIRRRRVVFDRGVRELKKLFDTADDVIVVCTQIWAMTWVEAAAPAGVRVIGQSHESFEASAGLTAATRGSTRYDRIRQLYRDIDAFLLLTAADAARFQAMGFNNTGVMHNPITMYPDAPASLDEPVIISVGRYAEQKNHRDLITAFATVAERHPEWLLKIFGSGPLHDELQQQIDAHGLHGRARLMGPTNEVEKELLASSIFALSSDFEGLPLVLAEAMACGVPCVAYDCSPGIREIVTDGVDGVVVAPRTPEELAAGLCRLIEDRELRKQMGKAARSQVMRFEADTVMAQWESLFDLVTR